MPSQQAGTERFQAPAEVVRKASFAGVADRSACRAALGVWCIFCIDSNFVKFVLSKTFKPE